MYPMPASTQKFPSTATGFKVYPVLTRMGICSKVIITDASPIPFLQPLKILGRVILPRSHSSLSSFTPLGSWKLWIRDFITFSLKMSLYRYLEGVSELSDLESITRAIILFNSPTTNLLATDLDKWLKVRS